MSSWLDGAGEECDVVTAKVRAMPSDSRSQAIHRSNPSNLLTGKTGNLCASQAGGIGVSVWSSPLLRGTMPYCGRGLR